MSEVSVADIQALSFFLRRILCYDLTHPLAWHLNWDGVCLSPRDFFHMASWGFPTAGPSLGVGFLPMMAGFFPSVP